MGRYEKLSIPRDTEIADAVVKGRLGALILANTQDLQLPEPAALERPELPLSEYEDAVAIGAINAMTSAEIGAQFPRGQASPKTVERSLKGVMDRLHAVNRAQLSRHLFCLGLALPDEDISDITPELTPTSKIILGLVSHGLGNAEIVDATQPWLSENAIKRSLMSTGDELRLVRDMLGRRRDASLTVTLAFEQNVFSVQPDLVMPAGFLVAGMQRLLDPQHELVVPNTRP